MDGIRKLGVSQYTHLNGRIDKYLILDGKPFSSPFAKRIAKDVIKYLYECRILSTARSYRGGYALREVLEYICEKYDFVCDFDIQKFINYEQSFSHLTFECANKRITCNFGTTMDWLEIRFKPNSNAGGLRITEKKHKEPKSKREIDLMRDRAKPYYKRSYRYRDKESIIERIFDKELKAHKRL